MRSEPFPASARARLREIAELVERALAALERSANDEAFSNRLLRRADLWELWFELEERSPERAHPAYPLYRALDAICERCFHRHSATHEERAQAARAYLRAWREYERHERAREEARRRPRSRPSPLTEDSPATGALLASALAARGAIRNAASGRRRPLS